MLQQQETETDVFYGNSLNTSGANSVRFVGIYVQGADGALVTKMILETLTEPHLKTIKVSGLQPEQSTAQFQTAYMILLTQEPADTAVWIIYFIRCYRMQ